MGREQAEILNSHPEYTGPIIRFSYWDGYLRNEDIVASERSVRPYSRINRSAESMQFAELVGASTDAGRLNLDPG